MVQRFRVRRLGFAFAFVFSWFSFAQTREVKAPIEYLPLTFGNVGEYAIYADRDGESTRYIGLLCLGGNELAIRLYEPSTGNELIVSQTFFLAGEGFDPSVAVAPLGALEMGAVSLIVGAFDSSPAAGTLLSAVYDWIDAWIQSRDRFDADPTYDFGEEAAYRFSFWIPAIQLERAGEVRLVTAGVATSVTDPSFFGWVGESKDDRPSRSVRAGSPRAISLGGLRMQLDSNWVESYDGSWEIRSRPSGCPGWDARVQVVPIGGSAESGAGSVFGLIRRELIDRPRSLTLLPDDVEFFVTGERPTLFYRVYDGEARRAEARYRLYMADGPALYMVSLDVAGAFFDGNRAYFESILFSSPDR